MASIHEKLAALSSLENKAERMKQQCGDKTIEELVTERTINDAELEMKKSRVENLENTITFVEKVSKLSGASAKDRKSLSTESEGFRKLLNQFSYLSHIKIQSCEPPKGKLSLVFNSTVTRKPAKVDIKFQPSKNEKDSFTIEQITAENSVVDEKIKMHKTIQGLIGTSGLKSLCHNIQSVVDGII